MSTTCEVAAFGAGLKYTDLTPHLIQRTKDHVLDQLGIQIGVSRKHLLKLAVDYVKAQANKPEASIACCPEKVSSENVEFVNGSFGHGFELDDVYAPALAHLGPAVVLAALAGAVRDVSSVEDFYDDEEVVNIYYQEMATHVKEKVGADTVQIFSHITRNEAQAETGERKGGHRLVHNDFTTSFGATLDPFLKETGINPKRIVVYNLW